MFKESIDDRLSIWADFRSKLETSTDPLLDVWEFWKEAPFVPYNHKINQFHRESWPTPWEIIVHNKYDDFTKALIISWTLKLSKPFKNSTIEIRSYIDKSTECNYNIVTIDNHMILNFADSGPGIMSDIPDHFLLENITEVSDTR